MVCDGIMARQGIHRYGNSRELVWNGMEWFRIDLREDFCERFVLQRKLSKPLYLKYMIIYFRNVLMLEMAPHLCICVDPFCFPSTHLDDVMSIEG